MGIVNFMSEGDGGYLDEFPRDYVSELDLSIEQYQRYTGYEKKYYGNLVAEAAVRLRDSQK